MIDESLILTYSGGTGVKSIATGDADLDATAIPGVLAWLFVTDAISVGGFVHNSLRVRVATSEVVPAGGACVIKIQFCAVPTAVSAVDLVTAVVTGAVQVVGTIETSSAFLSSNKNDLFVPIRQLPIESDYLQALIWVYPSGSDGLDTGRLYMSLCPLDDNSSHPVPNGI